jgi:hypothetical protein
MPVLKSRLLRLVLAGVGVLAVALLIVSAQVLYQLYGVPKPETTLRTLASGRELEVVAEMLESGEHLTWILEYRTTIPHDDPRQECEAAAVWRDVEQEASQTGATRAYIVPNNFEGQVRFDGIRPFVLSQVTTWFRLERADDGSWARAGGWSSTECGG